MLMGMAKPMLGVMIQELDQTTREAFGLGADTKGVLIGDVFKDQPADKAGFKRGDIVVSVDGKSVTSTNELRNQIASIRPGKKVPIKIIRNGKEQTLTVTLSGRDKAKTDQSAEEKSDTHEKKGADTAEKLGIKAGTITPEIRDRLNLSSNVKGVVVLEVVSGSQAEQEGFAESDIIIEINRNSIKTVNDFNKALKSVKPGDSILFLLQRQGNTFFKALKVRK